MNVGVWRDDEYLQKKKARTSIHDKREMIPRCVITVSALHAVQITQVHIHVHVYLSFVWHRR